MKHYILFGPPGAGKGTQAALMVDKFNFRHVSTGDVLRSEIKAGSEMGKVAQALIDKGMLVPDKMVESIIEGEIERHPEVNGFIFDGFPRTIAQAEDLDAMLSKRGEEVTAVISIVIDDAMVKERIRRRSEVSGRKDDMDDSTTDVRIRTYHEKTEPLIAYYRKQSKYKEIYGVGGIDDIFRRMCDLIEG